MNRNKLLTIAVLGLLVLNLGILGVLFLRKPQPPMHGEMGPPPPPGEGPKGIIIERLHLDAEQQKAFEVLITDHRAKTQAFQKATREQHDALFELLKTEPVNTVAADSIMQLISGGQKEIDHINFEHFMKIKALCKGDQVEAFNELVEDLGRLFSPKGSAPPPPPHGRP